MNSEMDLKTFIEEGSKFSVPSLKHLCVIKCTVELCYQKEVKDLLKCLKYPYDPLLRHRIKLKKEWKKIYKIIVDRLNSILIPKSLKDKILSYTFPIVLEIMKWYQDTFSELPEEFCWTVNGIIDRKNTARKKIKNELISIKERFIMSCLYCVDTDINLLWIDLPLEDKDFFMNRLRFPIISYWIMTLCAPREETLDIDKDLLLEEALIDAIKCNGLDLVRYLTSKLHAIERQAFLEVVFNRIVNTDENLDRIPEAEEADTWFFLFSQMTKELQLKYFDDEYSLDVIINLFFSSGRQKYLIMLMNLARANMKSYHYCNIGFRIMDKYLLDYKDFNYRKLFIQFWSNIPCSKKMFMRGRERFGVKFLAFLLKFHLKFLLENGTIKNKAKRISRYLNSNKLSHYPLIERDKWKLFLFLIQNQVVTWRDVKINKLIFLQVLNAREETELPWKKTLLLIRRIASKRMKPQLRQIPRKRVLEEY